MSKMGFVVVSSVSDGDVSRNCGKRRKDPESICFDLFWLLNSDFWLFIGTIKIYRLMMLSSATFPDGRNTTPSFKSNCFFNAGPKQAVSFSPMKPPRAPSLLITR